MRFIIVVLVALMPLPSFAEATGSGFFIADDGYFVTNFHVVEGGRSFLIRTVNGKEYPAWIVRTDQANDLAILKADGKFTPLAIDDSLNVKRGAKVATVGFPHLDFQGIEPKVTEGIVNSLSGIRDDARYFQISVQLGSGNSGGPLINIYGNVVGIVSSKLKAEEVYKQSGDLIQNVNYAIKSNYLRELVGSIPVLKDHLVSINKKAMKGTEELTGKAEKAIGLIVSIDATEVQPVQPSSETKADKNEQTALDVEKQKQDEIAQYKQKQDAERQRLQAETLKGFVSQGGLTWMPVNESRGSYEQANAYCANTAIIGQTGWRLPTKDELSSLYSSGAMNGHGWALNYTWTSTVGGLFGHYYIDLRDGMAIWFNAGANCSVTCVHKSWR